MSNFLSIEIYSCIILIILVTEYYSKFKRKLNRNSYIFLGVCVCLLFISLINISLEVITMSVNVLNIVKVLKYALAVIPSSLIYNYIYLNFFDSHKFIKSKNIFIDLFCILYWIILIIYVSNNQISVDNYYLISTEANKILLISVIPLVFLSLEWVYKNTVVKTHYKISYFTATILPVVGVIADISSEKFFFFVASYVLSLLIIYITKKNSIIYTDPLTGLYNRHLLEDNFVIDNIIKNNLIALYMIDVDKFKHINDTYGHNEGDAVLKNIAIILKNSTRRNDYVLRIGGDEFLIIGVLDNKNNKNIIEERIRNNLEEYNKNHEIKIGLSIGSEMFPENKSIRNIEKHLEKIDKKMYENKKAKK